MQPDEGIGVAELRLDPWSDEGLSLLVQANTPEMTAHLGGPETDEAIRDRHLRYLETSNGRGAMYMVRLLPQRAPIGIVGYWDRTWREADVYETGWSVLTQYQGRGLAVAATRLAMDQARAEGFHRFVHAFPSVDHAASNAVCRKVGFTLLGRCEFEYPPGHPLLTNDWCLDLMATNESSPPP
jgi:RimJ/RimL family protein N-acetyltransferase